MGRVRGNPDEVPASVNKFDNVDGLRSVLGKGPNVDVSAHPGVVWRCPARTK